MFRSRLQPLLHNTIHARASTAFQIRVYATRRPPDSNSLNYPLLNKLYDEYLVYSSDPNASVASVFKTRAFNTAMSTIEGLPFKVQRMEDVNKLKGIGEGMKRRIEEFLLTEEEHGNIPSTSQDVGNKKELSQAVKLFQTVSGIGPVRARKFAEQGFRTLDDVIRDPEVFGKLPKGIQTAFQYYSKTIEMIQREDIDDLASTISDTLKGFEVHITGSYRRGAPSSSDVDVLLFQVGYDEVPPLGPRPTSKKAQEKARAESPLLKDVVPMLVKAGVLGEELSSGPTKWQGLAKLPNAKDKFCRIDLNLMPTLTRGAALVGLTGDTEFNRHLRGKAIKLGLRLNDFGLWKRPRGWERSEITDTKDDTEWELIVTRAEEDIFNELGEGWVDPEKRNFNNLVGKKRTSSKG